MNFSLQHLVRLLCAFLASCSASFVVAAGELPKAAQTVVAESLAKAYGAAARIDNPDLIDGFGGGSPLEAFGAAMALDGDTLAVSAPGIYRNGVPRGAVFIFARSASTWQFQQRIEPSLYVGSGIALSGDRLAVLENEMQFGFVVRSIVRVFRRSAGQWQLESSLSPANAPDGSSVVSQSVALSGDVLAVGLDGIEVAGNVDQGAVDVFSAAGGSWQHQARVNYAGAAPNARVGRSVALRDGLLVAGAPGGIGTAQSAGSVVVFERQSGVWVQRAMLSAADGQAWSEFGASVATSLGSILVGAPAVDVSGRIDQGASYVFVRSGNSWVQQGKLVAFDGMAQSRFGGAVAMDANLALANGYVFERSGSSWGLRQKLSSARAANALQYGEALIADTWSAHQRGQIEVYATSGPGSFALVETLTLGNGGASRDLFGADVDIEGDVAVIGASRDSLVASYEQGSVTVMRRVADQWQVEAKLVASDGQPSDYLGHSVAISGDTIVAGAWNKNISGDQYAGAAYVFVRTGDQWIQQARLSAAGSLYFGTSIALDGDTIVVGSPGDPGSGGSSGAAYVFIRNAGVWTRTALVADFGGVYELW